MPTNIRPELSEKNKYWIDRHRYYELKHFCMQYQSWANARNSVSTLKTGSMDAARFCHSNEASMPTEDCAAMRERYVNNIELVERIAEKTDREIGQYILVGVVNGWSYDILNARLGVPCSKDVYYDLYRKFFWLLDKERD